MTPAVKEIVKSVAQEHGVLPVDVAGSSRRKVHSRARQEVFYRLRQRDPDFYSYPQIARQFNRTHATIIWGVREHLKRNCNTPETA